MGYDPTEYFGIKKLNISEPEGPQSLFSWWHPWEEWAWLKWLIKFFTHAQHQ